MTNRVSYTPQDFQKLSRPAEIDRESKRLVILLDRVKRQIATRQSGWNLESPKPPATAVAPPSNPAVPMNRPPSES